MASRSLSSTHSPFPSPLPAPSAALPLPLNPTHSHIPTLPEIHARLLALFPPSPSPSVSPTSSTSSSRSPSPEPEEPTEADELNLALDSFAKRAGNAPFAVRRPPAGTSRGWREVGAAPEVEGVGVGGGGSISTLRLDRSLATGTPTTTTKPNTTTPTPQSSTPTPARPTSTVFPPPRPQPRVTAPSASSRGPSSGASSFSDLSDASVSRTALEEAMLSGLQGTGMGTGTTVGRLSMFGRSTTTSSRGRG